MTPVVIIIAFVVVGLTVTALYVIHDQRKHNRKP